MIESTWQFREWTEYNSPFDTVIHLQATEVIVKHDKRTGYWYIVPTADSKVYEAHCALTTILAELAAPHYNIYMRVVYDTLYADIARQMASHREVTQ